MNKINNKGFSYVEMIIVLAIMGIMVGFLSISISTNYRNEVARTAEKFESRVNQARTAALTKGTANGNLNIAYVDNAYYTYIGEKLSDANNVKLKGEKLCNGNITMILVGNIDAGSPYRCLTFKQSTGGVQDSYGNIYTGYLHVMFKRNMQSVDYNIDGVTGKITR